MEKAKNFRKAIVIGAIAWGVVLAVTGLISGNQTLTNPNLDKQRNEILATMISASSFDCWTEHKRSDFKLVEFAKAGECDAHLSSSKGYQCYDFEKLQDSKWLREKFRSLNSKLIVFGDTRKESLYAASLLNYHGYNVRMLDSAPLTKNQLLITNISKPNSQVSFTNETGRQCKSRQTGVI